MIEKSESNQLSLATAPILGQAPSNVKYFKVVKELQLKAFKP